MTESRCWESDKGQRKFGFGGVQQLVLDIHLLLRIGELFVSEQTNSKANTVCEKALRLYFSQNRDVKFALKVNSSDSSHYMILHIFLSTFVFMLIISCPFFIRQVIGMTEELKI